MSEGKLMHDHSGTGAHRGKLEVISRQQTLKFRLIERLSPTREHFHAIKPQLSRLGTASGEVIPKHKRPSLGLRHECNRNA